MSFQENPQLKDLKSGQIINISKSPFSLGRGLESDYVVESKFISRKHCIFEKSPEGWTIVDNSTNGSLINTCHIKRIRSSILKNNDVIKLYKDVSYTFLINFRDNVDTNISNGTSAQIIKNTACSSSSLSNNNSRAVDKDVACGSCNFSGNALKIGNGELKDAPKTDSWDDSDISDEQMNSLVDVVLEQFGSTDNENISSGHNQHTTTSENVTTSQTSSNFSTSNEFDVLLERLKENLSQTDSTETINDCLKNMDTTDRYSSINKCQTSSNAHSSQEHEYFLEHFNKTLKDVASIKVPNIEEILDLTKHNKKCNLNPDPHCSSVSSPSKGYNYYMSLLENYASSSSNSTSVISPINENKKLRVTLGDTSVEGVKNEVKDATERSLEPSEAVTTDDTSSLDSTSPLKKLYVSHLKSDSTDGKIVMKITSVPSTSKDQSGNSGAIASDNNHNTAILSSGPSNEPLALPSTSKAPMFTREDLCGPRTTPKGNASLVVDILHDSSTSYSKQSFRLTVRAASKLHFQVHSEEFTVCHMPWQVVLKHFGPTEKPTQLSFIILSHFRTPGSTGWTVNTKLKLSLLSAVSQARNITKTDWHTFTSSRDYYVFSNFDPWEDVLDPQMGFIKDDEVTFQLDLEIVNSNCDKKPTSSTLASANDLLAALENYKREEQVMVDLIGDSAIALNKGSFKVTVRNASKLGGDASEEFTLCNMVWRVLVRKDPDRRKFHLGFLSNFSWNWVCEAKFTATLLSKVPAGKNVTKSAVFTFTVDYNKNHFENGFLWQGAFHPVRGYGTDDTVTFQVDLKVLSSKVDATSLDLSEYKQVIHKVEEKKMRENKPETSKASQEAHCSKQLNHFEKMENELQCAICSELFVRAITLGCSHTFCKYCIETWKKSKSRCPICRDPITSLTRTLVLDNVIQTVIDSSSEEAKEQRKTLLEERTKLENPPAPSPNKRKTKRAAGSTRGGRSYAAVVDSIVQQANAVIDAGQVDSDSDSSSTSSTTSSSNNDDSDNDTEFDTFDELFDYYGDFDGDMYDDYNGLPGVYYGGYGRCYRCGESGHWASGCPN